MTITKEGRVIRSGYSSPFSFARTLKSFRDPSLLLRMTISEEGRAIRALLVAAQLRQDTEVFERRRVPCDRLAAGHFLQQPPHDLAAARFRQRFGKPDLVRFRDGAD